MQITFLSNCNSSRCHFPPINLFNHLNRSVHDGHPWETFRHSCSAPSNELCVTISQQLVQQPESEIIPGQRSLPLSVHNRFVITLTNTDFSTSIGCVGSRLRARHRSRTTIVSVFAFLTSVDIRLRIRHFTLHTRFWVRHNTTDSRHQCSCCQRVMKCAMCCNVMLYVCMLLCAIVCY